MKKIAISFILLWWLTACSSHTSIESDMGISGAPDWVNEGTQAVDNEDGRFIYGVAFSPPINDLSLQTSSADSRARAEVGRVISTYIDSTLTDFSSSSHANTSSSIQQNLVSVTQTVLRGARIKGRWKEEKTGNIYSFAEMDMKALDDAILAAEKLSSSFRDYYSESASANFDRFMKGNRQ